MGVKLRKNFGEFVTEQEQDSESSDNFDLSLYKRFKSVNKKSEETIFFQLLAKVFDEDLKKIEEHLESYLELLVRQKAVNKQGILEGISSFIAFMPEQSLDQPQVHSHLWNYVLRPLISNGVLQLKDIKWDKKIAAADADADDEEVLFDAPNCSYRLLGLILAHHLNQSNAGAKSAKQHFKNLGVSSHLKAWWPKIDEPAALWKAIADEAGAKYSPIILNILKDG